MGRWMSPFPFCPSIGNLQGLVDETGDGEEAHRPIQVFCVRAEVCVAVALAQADLLDHRRGDPEDATEHTCPWVVLEPPDPNRRRLPVVEDFGVTAGPGRLQGWKVRLLENDLTGQVIGGTVLLSRDMDDGEALEQGCQAQGFVPQPAERSVLDLPLLVHLLDHQERITLDIQVPEPETEGMAEAAQKCLVLCLVVGPLPNLCSNLDQNPGLVFQHISYAHRSRVRTTATVEPKKGRRRVGKRRAAVHGSRLGGLLRNVSEHDRIIHQEYNIDKCVSCCPSKDHTCDAPLYVGTGKSCVTYGLPPSDRIWEIPLVGI